MSNPAYSLDNITFLTFPGSYRYGGKPKSRMDEDITLLTDSGVEYTESQFSRRSLTLNFRFSDSDLTFFSTFNTAVSGQNTPFYFSLSGAGASDSILVRKEAGFDPQELTTPGDIYPYYDYTLYLREQLS